MEMWTLKLLFVLAVLSTAPCDAKSAQLKDDEIRDKINSFAEAALKCDGVPGMHLAVVRDGQVFMTNGYGVEDQDTQKPFTNATMVIIASLSKAFVSTVMGQVLEENTEHTWYSKVRDILGDWFYLSDPFRTDQLLIRDILSHRTGLPRNDALTAYDHTLNEMVRRLRFLDFSQEFRDGYQYNNLMYGLAAHVIQTLAGNTWEDTVRDKLFTPLQMDATTFVHLAEDRWPEFATSYLPYEGSIRKVSLESPKGRCETSSAAGCIASNAEDMAKWMLFHLNDGKAPDGTELIHPDTLQEIHSPAMASPDSANPIRPNDNVTWSSDKVALGWFEGFYRGYPVSSHAGSSSGYQSLLSLLPAANIGIYNAVNLPDVNARRYIQMYIMDLLLGEEPWLDNNTLCEQLRTNDESYVSESKAPADIVQMELEKMSSSNRASIERAIRHDYCDIITTHSGDPSPPDCQDVSLGGALTELLVRQQERNFTAYEGTYGHFAYGNSTVYVHEPSGELHARWGSNLLFNLTQVTQTFFVAEGQEPNWSFVAGVTFDDEQLGQYQRVEVLMESTFPPTFIRGLDFSDAPPPPELCP